MKNWIKYSLAGFVFFNIVLCAWSILHNDIYYYTDIARDFLIFDEIVAKKLVLFGPRADMQGLFHGILWHYVNVPAYVVGGGNPVFVGWFWMLLTVGFLGSVFYVAKKLFGEICAFVATALVSASVVMTAQGFFHGNGATLIMPLFFYSIVRYVQTLKAKYLLSHLIIVGMLVQFEIAVGVPLAILSAIFTLLLIVKKRLWKHLYSFLALIPFAATFLLIELRYDFLQFRSLMNYARGTRDGGAHTPFVLSLLDRFRNIGTQGINIAQAPLQAANFILFSFLLGGIVQSKLKRDKNTVIYGLFLYFYFGYYALTMLHGGYLIKFWWLPMSILPILMISSLYQYIPKRIYGAFIALFLGIVTMQNIGFIQNTSAERGKKTHSWQLHYANAQNALAKAPTEYGYFIYAPDIYGYQDKYAFLYASRQLQGKGFAFEKKQTTYVLSEPPPANFVGQDTDWWVKVKLKIASEPIVRERMPGGYEVRTYKLSSEDLSTPSEIPISDWLFYR